VLNGLFEVNLDLARPVFSKRRPGEVVQKTVKRGEKS
jgi:hypothetical protein